MLAVAGMTTRVVSSNLRWLEPAIASTTSVSNWAWRAFISFLATSVSCSALCRTAFSGGRAKPDWLAIALRLLAVVGVERIAVKREDADGLLIDRDEIATSALEICELTCPEKLSGTQPGSR
jgi:hypothetical protein